MFTHALRRRRALWVGLLTCLLVPVALYAVLPVATAAVLTYLFHQQGYQHVTVQVGYPGWHTLQVPLLSFQKDLDSEALAVTVRDSRLEYDLGTLFSGRVRRLTIPHASVSLRGRSANEGQPCMPSQPAPAGPGLLARVTVGHLVAPVPELPWHTLVLEQVRVFRACATGPLRDVLLSGSMHQSAAAAEGVLVFQGHETAPYRLRFAMPQVGSLEVTLHAEPSVPGSIVAVQSHVSQSPSGLQLVGKATADFAQLAPFLALSMPLGVDLQHVAGTMQATWTGTAPATASLDTAWHDPAAVVSGTVALTLTLPRLVGVGENLSVRLHGTVTGNAEQLAWTLEPDTRLHVDLDHTALPLPDTLHWLLPPSDRRVVVECPESVKGHVGLAARPLQFTLQGPVRATYGAAQAPLQMEIAVLRMEGRGTEHLTAAATYRLQGAATIPPDGLAAPAVEWHLHGTLALDNAQLRGMMEASSAVHLRDMRQAAVRVPVGTVQLTDRLPFRVHLGTRHWGAGPAHIDVRTPHVVWQDTPVSINQASVTLHRLHGDSLHWQTEGALHLSGVSAQLPTAPLPVTDWHAGFSVDDAALRLEVKGTLFGETVTLVSNLEYLFASRAGSAHLHLHPIQFDPARLAWSKMVTPWPYPVDVTGGRLAATASLTWQPDARAREPGAVLYTGGATVTLDQLSGQYKNVMVQGLTTSLQLHIDGADAITMPEPAAVTIAALQTGVEVTDVSLQLQLGWTPPATLAWAELRDVSASLLGGRVMSEGLRFDAARPEHGLLLTVEQLDLQQLLQLEQQKGVEGTGVLDGVMPIVLTPTGVQVQDGWLEARPPGGILRYQPAPETAPADTPMQVVLQALTNFHYNVLKLGVQYREDGTLNLAARLEGQNPEWQEGRPVHFNLNVQENIPALLKSLQIAQGIQHTIEEHFKRR